MTSTINSRRLALALFLLLCRSATAEEWILAFAVTEDKVIESPKGDAPPRTETRNYTQTVALGTGYLATEDERQKIIQDFAGRRMIALDLAPGTYNDWSLYGLPSFFEHELFNRNALGAGMRAAKIEQMAAAFSRFDNETALHVESRFIPPDPPVPVIDTLKLEGAIEFRHEGTVVVRFVPADTPLPAAWHHRFVNYLAYSCSIHPRIRRAIADTGAIPQELVFTWRSVNTTTTTRLRLISSAAAGTDSSALPVSARPAAPANDPLFAVLAAVDTAARNPTRPPRAETVAFADQAVARNQPLDALLALIEFGLQSGEQLTDEIRRHRATFDHDPACQAYLKALKASGQTDKEAAERNLAVNAGIDRRPLARAHMLDLERANLLERTGRPREAMEHFFTVLRANPYHAGALHDLGMVYLHGFDHSKAWLCWDAARRLYPSHPMMGDVLRLEQELQKNQPDFF